MINVDGFVVYRVELRQRRRQDRENYRQRSDRVLFVYRQAHAQYNNYYRSSLPARTCIDAIICNYVQLSTRTHLRGNCGANANELNDTKTNKLPQYWQRVAASRLPNSE